MEFHWILAGCLAMFLAFIGIIALGHLINIKRYFGWEAVYRELDYWFGVEK